MPEYVVVPDKVLDESVVDDWAAWVIDHMAPVEWDVQVWNGSPTPGRLDAADARRILVRALELIAKSAKSGEDACTE